MTAAWRNWKRKDKTYLGKEEENRRRSMKEKGTEERINRLNP